MEHPGADVGRPRAVEDEVAHAVGHRHPGDLAQRLQHVGVRADDDVGARLDQLGGQRLLPGRRADLLLDAPVQERDDQVGGRADGWMRWAIRSPSLAEASPGLSGPAVQAAWRLESSTSVAEMTAMRTPWMVVR